jgi:hypothetical protein
LRLFAVGNLLPTLHKALIFCFSRRQMEPSLTLLHRLRLLKQLWSLIFQEHVVLMSWQRIRCEPQFIR